MCSINLYSYRCHGLTEFKKKKKLHWPGIEPGPPTWQARILPLNHQCAHSYSVLYRTTPLIILTQKNPWSIDAEGGYGRLVTVLWKESEETSQTALISALLHIRLMVREWVAYGSYCSHRPEQRYDWCRWCHLTNWAGGWLVVGAEVGKTVHTAASLVNKEGGQTRQSRNRSWCHPEPQQSRPNWRRDKKHVRTSLHCYIHKESGYNACNFYLYCNLHRELRKIKKHVTFHLSYSIISGYTKSALYLIPVAGYAMLCI